MDSFNVNFQICKQCPLKKPENPSSYLGVRPQGNKANVEDEKVEKSFAAEMPERSSESGQDYVDVESIEAVGSQLPLLGDRPNQPRNHFLEI